MNIRIVFSPQRFAILSVIAIVFAVIIGCCLSHFGVQTPSSLVGVLAYCIGLFLGGVLLFYTTLVFLGVVFIFLMWFIDCVNSDPEERSAFRELEDDDEVRTDR